MRRDTAIRQAEALLKIHGLWDKGWRMEWMRGKSTLGLCYHGRKVIAISTHMVDANDEKTVGLIVLHEIAHALNGTDEKDEKGRRLAHGPRWQEICLSIGGDGKRCSDADVNVEYPWIGTCINCGKTTGQHRAPLVVRVCKQCGKKGVSVAERVFVWSKNGAPYSLSAMPDRYVREVLALRRQLAGFPL